MPKGLVARSDCRFQITDYKTSGGPGAADFRFQISDFRFRCSGSKQISKWADDITTDCCKISLLQIDCDPRLQISDYKSASKGLKAGSDCRLHISAALTSAREEEGQNQISDFRFPKGLRQISKESDCRLQMPTRAWGAQERAVQISDSRFQMPPNCKVA